MELSKEKRVRDVMTRGVITVPLDTSVNEIARIMVEGAISGIAVITPECEVVGVISEIDFIKFFDQDWNRLTAEDIMSTFVRAIEPEMTIKKAADTMKELNIHRLLVLSRKPTHGAPVGILTASDILKAIIKSH